MKSILKHFIGIMFFGNKNFSTKINIITRTSIESTSKGFACKGQLGNFVKSERELIKDWRSVIDVPSFAAELSEVDVGNNCLFLN